MDSASLDQLTHLINSILLKWRNAALDISKFVFKNFHPDWTYSMGGIEHLEV